MPIIKCISSRILTNKLLSGTINRKNLMKQISLGLTLLQLLPVRSSKIISNQSRLSLNLRISRRRINHRNRLGNSLIRAKVKEALTRETRHRNRPLQNFNLTCPATSKICQKTNMAPPSQRPIPGQNMNKERSMGSRQYEQYQQQYGYEINHPTAQDRGPTAHFPSRDANRAQPQPRSATDTHQYPTEEPQLKQERSFSDTQQPPFSNHSRSYNRARPDAHQHGGAAYGQASYANHGQPSSLRSYGGVNDLPYDGEMRPGRPQGDFTQKSYENDGAPTVPAGTSSHPPPVRQYGQRGASGPISDPPNHPSGPRSPDSLPIHPTPVQPGLMSTGSDAQRSSPDRRAQQQPRTANPQQPLAPATATAATPSSTNIKQKPPPITSEELNMLQQQARTNPNDHTTALKLAKKLKEAASILANKGGRADAKTTTKNREKFVFDAHKLLKKLVSAEYPEAIFYLADFQGKLGLKVDPREAFSLY